MRHGWESIGEVMMENDLDPLNPMLKPTPNWPLLGLTILIVEDNRYSCEAMRFMALRSGASSCLRLSINAAQNSDKNNLRPTHLCRTHINAQLAPRMHLLHLLLQIFAKCFVCDVWRFLRKPQGAVQFRCALHSGQEVVRCPILWRLGLVFPAFPQSFKRYHPLIPLV